MSLSNEERESLTGSDQSNYNFITNKNNKIKRNQYENNFQK